VTDFDSTSVLILKRVDGLLSGRGCRLLLAGLAEGSDFRCFLHEVGFDRPEQEGRIFAELDFALAHAEIDCWRHGAPIRSSMTRSR